MHTPTPTPAHRVSMASFQAVAYEYAIEMTYPLAEGTSSGLVNLGSQVIVLTSVPFREGLGPRGTVSCPREGLGLRGTVSCPREGLGPRGTVSCPSVWNVLIY